MARAASSTTAGAPRPTVPSPRSPPRKGAPIGWPARIATFEHERLALGFALRALARKLTARPHPTLAAALREALDAMEPARAYAVRSYRGRGDWKGIATAWIWLIRDLHAAARAQLAA